MSAPSEAMAVEAESRPAPTPDPAPVPPVAPPNPSPPAPPRPNLRELPGRRLALVKRPDYGFELHEKSPPAPGSLQHWGIQKHLPAWLIAAMAVKQPVNKLWSEDEFDDLAHKTAGLSLGRKGA